MENMAAQASGVNKPSKFLKTNFEAQAANEVDFSELLKNSVDARNTHKVDFSDALKNTLNQVDHAQKTANQLGERLLLGDKKISLSDVMIETQKANIQMQMLVKVNTRLVAAYHDIMNMPV